MIDENNSFLTALQLEIIDRLRFFEGDIQRTALDMGRNEQSIYNILHNIRKARVKAQNTVNLVNTYMRDKDLRKYIY